MFMTTDEIGRDEYDEKGAYFVGNCIGDNCRDAWVFADTTFNRGRWVPTYINFDNVAYIRRDMVELVNGESFYLHPKSLEYLRMHTGYSLLKNPEEVY